MKFIPFVASLALAFVSRALAIDPPPTDVVVIDHRQVDHAFATGGALHANSSYRVQAGRRVVAGNVELHANDADIFYVTEGSATIITGGKIEGAKEIGPGEVHGDKITGGVSRQLTKGDVIVIPAGVPHWFSEVSGTFLYFVVKVTK